MCDGRNASSVGRPPPPHSLAGRSWTIKDRAENSRIIWASQANSLLTRTKFVCLMNSFFFKLLTMLVVQMCNLWPISLVIYSNKVPEPHIKQRTKKQFKNWIQVSTTIFFQLKSLSFRFCTLQKLSRQEKQDQSHYGKCLTSLKPR